MVNKALLLFGLLSLVTACGGGSGGGSGMDPRLARLDLYEAQRMRVLGDPAAGALGMPVTPDAVLPTAGQVVFQGAATILVERPAENMALAGDMTLTVSFASQSATGAVTNVFGTGATAAVTDYAGSLNLSGQVNGVTFPLDYTGTLTGGSDSLIFAGTLDATFLGEPVAGFAALDLEAEIDNDGVARAGAIVLFGEGTVTQPPPP